MGLNDNETNKTFPWHKWILNILLTAEEVFKHVLKNFMCYFISVSSNVVCVIHRCVHVKFALYAKININLNISFLGMYKVTLAAHTYIFK